MAGRWWRWCDHYRRITCPCGHYLPFKTFSPESTFTRCDAWDGAAKKECGRWCYLLAIRGDGVLVCEVRLEDLDKMQKFKTPSEILGYLNILNLPTENVA